MNTLGSVVAGALDTVPTEATIVVGYSGGLDSTVLLHAVNAWRLGCDATQRPGLFAMHVHHGLSIHADDWLAHCVACCAAWDITLRVERVNVSTDGNPEAAARAARYAAFTQGLTRSQDRLLLAHHADDQLETVLLRLFSGRGVLGMPAQRTLGAGRLLRPLLNLPRTTLAQYARAEGLSWVSDESNWHQHLDRNWLRYRLLPQLEQRWPNLGGRLKTVVDEQNQAHRLLEQVVAAKQTLTVEDLNDPGTGATLLRVWLFGHREFTATRKALIEFTRQVLQAAQGQPQLRLTHGSLWRFRGEIHYVPDPPVLASAYQLPCPGELCLPHGVLRCGPTNPVCISQDPGFWTVRFRRPGDRLRSHNGSRGLSELFREHGIAPWLRDQYPLVVAGAGPGERVLCVPGLARADLTEIAGQPESPLAHWKITWHPLNLQ